MEDLFLQLVLIEPVFTEQVLWQELDSETQTESQYSRFDSQISKLAKKQTNKKSNCFQHLFVNLGTLPATECVP